MSGDARIISPRELKRTMRMFWGSRMRHGQTYHFLEGIARVDNNLGKDYIPNEGMVVNTLVRQISSP
jgi:hypothetical protein